MLTLSLVTITLGIIGLLGASVVWGLKMVDHVTPSDIL